uniref:Secreted protein n=1 Tax=Klebsiella phage HenuGS TaxID=3350566 RepID=A0AB74UNT5_9CAUD
MCIILVVILHASPLRQSLRAECRTGSGYRSTSRLQALRGIALGSIQVPQFRGPHTPNGSCIPAYTLSFPLSPPSFVDSQVHNQLAAV